MQICMGILMPAASVVGGWQTRRGLARRSRPVFSGGSAAVARLESGTGKSDELINVAHDFGFAFPFR
jgi:hypothetical protein